MIDASTCLHRIRYLADAEAVKLGYSARPWRLVVGGVELTEPSPGGVVYIDSGGRPITGRPAPLCSDTKRGIERIRLDQIKGYVDMIERGVE